ncbi:MAG TPA: RDD family protein [Candidatus Bathyarchaeia archaeon]|nr:RDD family protein [Candidatus Bathyarchaeia archaeon]
MQRRFEAVRINSTLQNLWTRRAIAFVIDSIILLIVFVILNAVLALVLFVPLLVFNVNAFGGVFSGFSALFGVIVVWGYYVALEGSTGATIGKRFMDVKVRSLGGSMTYTKAFVRSFTKAWLPAFALLFALDLVVGFATQGDPRQRFSDTVANTAVIHSRY